MPKARLYFDGDNSGIEKEARIYSLTQEVEDKLDSISNFQDEIDDLQDQINNLASRGRYLSTWNAVTGLPETNPQVDPYVYRAGDYYIVSVVGGTNYRPTGSEYHVGVASQVVESQSVSQNDLYIYDGIQWVLQGSGSSLLAVWGSITGTLSAQTDLQNALDAKANKTDVLEKTNTTSYTPAGDYNPATKKYVDDEIANIDLSTKQDKLTAGDNIQISNTNVISATDTTYNAGENITIEDICTTESDMKGPAPSGFHVPTKDEWVALCGILTSTFSMASNATTMGTYLKMPMAGRRERFAAGAEYQGTAGYYWSSSRYDEDEAYHLYFSSSNLRPQNGFYRSYGFSVRCFKDTPTIPDSSWTTLHQGTGNAGIFWNSSLGLISVSGDGTTWYTIQDKNLGAAVVFNQGDTVNGANSGYFYQWGNNYGFAWAGTVTTSSAQVDTSTYGPGNYYSSDVFITGGNDWSLARNDNLRGGVSQGTFQDCIHNVISAENTTYTAGSGINIDQNNEISNSLPFNPDNAGNTDDVLTKTANGYEWSAPSGGDVVVSSQPNNILTSGMKIRAGTEGDYENLGVYDNNTVYLTVAGAATPGRHPGVNTIAYYPLETDANDYSGNSRDATNNGATFTTEGGINCASFSDGNTKISLPALGTLTTLTASVWFKTININPNSVILQIAPSTDDENFVLGCNNGTGALSRYTGTSYNITDGNVSDGTWHNMVGTYTASGGAKLYVDGVYIGDDSTATAVSGDLGYSFIGGHQSGQSGYAYIGYISNVILEDKEWTSTEVSDYYDETKGDYGIS